MTDRALLCGAQLKSVFGTCARYGEAMYGGRCWQHRPRTQTDHDAAKARRRAEFAAQERRVDENSARVRFVESAVNFGLDDSRTREAFERLKECLTRKQG